MISRKTSFLGNHQGFTLVELMITLVMAGIIVAAIYSAYIIQQKTYYTQGQVADMQQNNRAGLEVMTSEIQMATYDPSSHKAGASITTANATTFAFTSDLDGNGDVLGTDENVTYGITGTELMRTPLAGAPQAIAEGIAAIEFYYFLDDGVTQTLTPTPAQLSKIQTVQVTLLAVASQKDIKYTNSTTYYTGSGAPWGPFGDNFRRRLLTATVNLRNHGLH